MIVICCVDYTDHGEYEYGYATGLFLYIYEREIMPMYTSNTALFT